MSVELTDKQQAFVDHLFEGTHEGKRITQRFLEEAVQAAGYSETTKAKDVLESKSV